MSNVSDTRSEDRGASVGHGAVDRLVRPGRLAMSPVIERTWAPDRNAMAAALRVVLGFPRRLPAERPGEER